MSIQKRSDEFKNWIAQSDIFDIDIWWDPMFEEGFILYIKIFKGNSQNLLTL